MEEGRALLLCLITAACFHGNIAQRTECAKASVADIVFLVDGSSSIGVNNFQEVRGFLRSVISGLDVGPDKVRVGVAQFSDEPHQEFLLKEHQDKQSLLQEVDRLPYRTGGTQTGKAMDFILSRYFTKDAGSRAAQRVPQIAVVITDGDSTDDVVGPAQRLKQRGVIVFGIGVGQANLKELESIANRPPQRFLFTIDNYQALQRLSDGLLQTVCVSMEDQRQAISEKFADIFFLVDAGVPATEFQQIRTLILRLLNQLSFSSSMHRLGFAQYARDTEVDFHLNTYQTKDELQSNVRRLRQRKIQPNEPRNLGAALQHAAHNLFTSEHGSRADQGYRQVLVLLSGKASDDSMYKQARLLKAEGVTVVGIGIGGSITEMRLIATPPYLYQSISTAVPKLRGIIEQEEVETILTGDCKAAKLADVVFIVDESGSITTPNFQLVRTFLHSIVSGLEVAQNRVRVGIVMYSDRSEAQVYLNTFNNKTELLNFIKILPYRGGGTNTGAALKFTKDNVFVKSRGSRRDKGVQQVAVVITDGQSQDDVAQAGAELRRAGVTVYAVGVKDANEAQLVEMASHPPNKHVFIVDTFSKLKSLEQSLQKILCHNVIRQAMSVSTRRSGIKEGCQQTDEADIFFLIDHSGSIWPNDFHDMKKFIIEFLHTFRISPQHVRLGVAKYADDPNLEFDLTTYTDAKVLEKAVEAIKQVGGGTETGKALAFMDPLFEKAMRTRGHKVPEYLVVITDGKSTDQVAVPAKKLAAQGVIVYAIGVKNADHEELLDIAGDKRRTFFVNNFDALKPIKDDIITDICSPDACKDIPGDLLFLVDSSGSIYPKDYNIMKEFIKSVIGKSVVGPDQVHVGVMQFSSTQQLEFPLNRFFSKEEMSVAIDGMQQIGGGTDTGKAIALVSQYFDLAQGGRPGLRQRLVVITDGEAQDEVKGPAATLRAKGVVIYAIGVVDANTTQLLEISGSPDKMYTERDFDALKDLESQVALELCDPERDCKKTEKADIIFLVDGSTSITLEKFRSMQKFMVSMVNQTTVGTNLTRFGVILYSTEPNSVFTLNQHSSKKEVTNAIAVLRPPYGDTYTGKALDYCLQYFEPRHGGRHALQVPQILMVITDGDATDRNSLVAPSVALRQKGVTVFGIGVEGANKTQLEIMASNDASRVFYVDNFDALETLHMNISQVLCESTKAVCEKQKADLVFLLDQSGSIASTDYTLMKKFTMDLVSSFKVGEDLVRVGVAQFSSDFQQEFYLNQYFTEKAVFEHVLKMQQLGGGTKIGRALEAILDHFEESRGSRRASLVSQNLVLITDGESEDDVADAAERLRARGVEVFVIGIGNVHDLELLQVTRSPEKLFTVQDFTSLEKIKQRVVDTICKSTPSETTGCSIDIAMGFDISQRSGAPGETLVSGHPKLRTFLPEISHYVSSVSGLCCLDNKPIKTNIGYRVASADGTTLYDFNFEEYSEDVVKKVMTLRLDQPTLFNSALLQSFRQKFSSQSGTGVKVLVIFSDGLDEDMMKLEHQSDLLRQSGVSALLVVSLEGVRDSYQMQMLEFGRGFGYNLPLSIGMPSVSSSILKQIDSVSNRECCDVMCKCSGNEGDRGSRGSPGSKGVSGQKGYPGFPGEEGVAGERGRPGPSGPQGVQGCSGLRGQKGNRGLRGNRGEDGGDGLNGVNGEQGVTGADGGPGERGFPGNPGIPGIQGEAGPQGQRGLRGDPGEPGSDNSTPGTKGEQGNPGLPGPPGQDGRPGESGVEGNPGPDGRRGQLGEKGARGQPGAAGVQGTPGASGPQGPRGVRGQPGPRGIPGLPGPQGRAGTPGEPGAGGRRGGNGQKGQPGDPGDKGAAGPLGPRGMSGQDGRDGYGTPGPRGAKGDPGFPGYPGLSGEDGLQGPKGLPGRKGNRGRGGNSGLPGESGVQGEWGHPGHKGPRGPPGGRTMKECQLVSYIRDNCACSIDQSQCPSYPTELVFGLDMSDDVTPASFERQRSALLALLEGVAVAESNCPRGARVSVVGFSSYAKYLIRFQDHRRRGQLLDAVQNLALERTSNKRHLGAAMRFVGRHVFKRVRSGKMTRKVAVFFSNGPTQDAEDVMTAVMEYRGLNVDPAVVSLRNAPAVSRAMEVDDSGRSVFTVLRKPEDLMEDLRRVKTCTVCYDPCTRSQTCASIPEPLQPQQVDVDLVLVPDGSREMRADQYTGALQLLGSVVEHLEVSPEPGLADGRARVASVQRAELEFGLQSFQKPELIRRHLLGLQQRGGPSSPGRTLELALPLLLKAAAPRRRKAMLMVVSAQAALADRARLHRVALRAKCQGVALFIVTVGNAYNRTQVEDLAARPLQQHLVHVSALRAEQQEYTQRFFRVFLSALHKGVHSYPPPSLKRRCDQLSEQEEQLPTDGQEFVDVDEVIADEEHKPVRKQLNIIQTSGSVDSELQIFGSRTKDACFLPQNQGGCQNYTMMWFFDTEQSECSRFWFGGCGGNENRFRTQQECEELCLTKSR
ncbi:collagen alpha-6(VI) chain isoform X2 [Gouania willdenowi]|uniref:collagen alpha-6(VI) chain isoform X2 n=1 Tax=Gouania willdenowi TaxID=441366 RepID=UPI001056AD52|nr:collagen alpha-6(VI) chain isoform X2 [Gouania willdenowi]